MSEPDPLEQAFASGRFAGSIADAQAHECPFGHNEPDQRDAWFRGFSAGRSALAKIKVSNPEETVVLRAKRMVPFGSHVVFHHSTRTIAVTVLGKVHVLGPYPDEEVAYQAAHVYLFEQATRS